MLSKLQLTVTKVNQILKKLKNKVFCRDISEPKGSHT